MQSWVTSLAACEKRSRTPLVSTPPDLITLGLLLDQRNDAESITWVSSWELDALVDLALGGPGNVVGRALYRHLPELFERGSQHYLGLVRFCWTRFRT